MHHGEGSGHQTPTYEFRSQAGIVIAQESGGFVSGGPHVNHDGDATEEILHGRKYIVVR